MENIFALWVAQVQYLVILILFFHLGLEVFPQPYHVYSCSKQKLIVFHSQVENRSPLYEMIENEPKQIYSCVCTEGS